MKPRPTKNPEYQRYKHLSKEEREFIFKNIGCNFPDAEIVRMAERELGVSINCGTISYYRHTDEFQPVINKFRRQFEASIIGVELASKRRRVEELNKIYYLLLNTGRYESALKPLAQIQGELEGAKKTENTFNYNQYINLSNDEIKQKLYENAKKIFEITEKKELTSSAQITEPKEAAE